MVWVVLTVGVAAALLAGRVEDRIEHPLLWFALFLLGEGITVMLLGVPQIYVCAEFPQVPTCG